jgi:glucosamine-6-phosphate deaminase
LAQVTQSPDSVLGLATGATVEGIYSVLVEWYEGGLIDFSQVKTVNLDEYVGLPPVHPQSYAFYMNENLFSKVNIPLSQTHIQNGLAKDLEAECLRYDRVIEGFGRLDLQLLGLGHNGHIGFNEPSESYHALTHCVELKEETIRSNSRFFHTKEEVPRRALTVGIKSISQAKTALLCVSGSHKAEILRKVLTGPITPQVPGSILQLHPNLIVVTDVAVSGNW